MSISVICPVLNEGQFIKAWAHCVSRFADQVIVFDTGSTDGTYDLLKPFKFNLVRWTQPRFSYGIPENEVRGIPYVPYTWNESYVRNAMINLCRGDWICNLDVDELVGDDFIGALPQIASSACNFHRFTQYAFWYSPNLIRVRQLHGPEQPWRRYYPGGRQIRVFRNLPSIRYHGGNHASLQWHGLGKLSPRLSEKNWDIPFFHYHFVHGPKTENDNRLTEYGKSGTKLMTYFGEHPRETKFYEWIGGQHLVTRRPGSSLPDSQS